MAANNEMLVQAQAEATASSKCKCHMESSIDTEIHQLESVTEKEGADCDLRSSDIAQEPDSGIISVQLLEFRTSLLEAVEELHIHREAEIRYEAQICKLVLEKQELEWQKESLQSRIDRMTNEHSESLATFKKQAQVRGIEGEKGKHQLMAELKDKEISSLKEELKLLQLFKYSLEKKLSELEQKLQLQTQVKDRHLNQLGEVEKRFGTVMRQCAMVKQAHEKLEQNGPEPAIKAQQIRMRSETWDLSQHTQMEEAMRLNKKLTSINKIQESTISVLKQDVERLNSEMVKCKVMSICRSGEENSNFLLKEQQLQELKQKLIVETELNKKLSNEYAEERVEQQKLMSSLQHTQGLLQIQTQAVCRIEQQLLTHTQKYQVLKREHEMIQERSKEKEDRLMRVIEEYKHSKLTLEKEMQTLQAKMDADQKELKALKVAYDDLLEKHQLSSCAVHQANNIHGLENDFEDSFNVQKDSPRNIYCNVHLHSACNLCKNAPLDAETGHVGPQNYYEQMRHCKEAEDIPDERTAGCQEAAKDDCFHGEDDEVNICSQMDRTALVLPPLHGLDALAPDQSERSENISGVDVSVTHLHNDPVVKQEASVIKTACDNGCPLSVAQSYTDSCLASLSEPETRSVYGVATDSLMSESRDRPEEQSLGVSEMREHQTSDKHTSETSQDGDFKEVECRITAPDTNSPQKVLPNNSESTEGPIVAVDSETNPTLQNKGVHNNQMKQRVLGETNSGTPQPIITDSHGEKTLHQAASFPDPALRQSDGQSSQLQGKLSKDGSLLHQETIKDIEANSIPEAELNTAASLSSFSQGPVDITVNLLENPGGNKTEDKCASTQMMREQENPEASPSPLISNLQEDASSIALTKLTKQGQLYDTEKQITDNEPSYLDDREGYESSFEPSKSVLPSGFQELLTTLNAPLFSKHKFRNRVITQPFDKLNVSNTRPDQKHDHHGEWHAIKRTFSEISVEEENRVPISFSSAQLGSPAAQSVGNGLRHDRTPTSPPRLHSLGKVSQLVSEESTPTPLEKEDHHHCDIRAQISKIEQFLSSEGFRPQKRSRIEKSEVLKP